MFEAIRFRGDQTPSNWTMYFTNEKELIGNLKYVAPLCMIIVEHILSFAYHCIFAFD